MNKKRKLPADYPQFYCRMTTEEKIEIESLIQEVTDLAVEKWRKKDAAAHTLKPKRNEFIAKALRRGLRQLRKELD